MDLPVKILPIMYVPYEVSEEFYAARAKVALCDYSSFAKFDLWSSGREVVDFLQKLCANDIDMPLGHIKHTGMHNKHGGYENDCSVARLQENRFMLMSPSIQQMKSYAWMRHQLNQLGFFLNLILHIYKLHLSIIYYLPSFFMFI